jgi:predicted enzyme related to lactoylglutathione lyase
VTPRHPDPAFAARLRDRLQRAFDLPKGVTVSNLTLESQPAPDQAPDPAIIASVTPYLAVAGAPQAIEWYTAALGSRLRADPVIMPDGRIGHAELVVAGGLVMLSEEHPEIGVVAPAPGQGAAVTIHLAVVDVDAVIDRAVAQGADLMRPVADHDYGRNGVIRDPFGHRWLISGATPGPAGPRPGDLGYASLWVPDVERAATFFSAVLGWRFGPASGPEGLQIQGLNLHHGMWGGETHATLFQCFAVDDVDAAVARVHQAGGTAAEPTVEPYGRVSECVDDQGVRFAVYEPPGGVSLGASPAPNGSRAGDLSYVTMEVVDSDRARAFYGTVLGWRFAPGRVDDGWGVEETAPTTGLRGGHRVATTVPMYRVDDIEAAVRRVRAAGGTATDPQVQPYGTTSDCTDDQGTRFYLGAL